MKVQYGNSQNLGGMAPAGQPAGMGGGMPSQANPAAMGRNPMAAGAMSPLMARPGSGFLPPQDRPAMPPQAMGGMGGGQGLATAPGQNRSLLPAQAQANMQAPMPGGGMSVPVPPPTPTIQPSPMPQTTMGAAGAAPNMLMQAAQSGALRGR